MIVFKLIFLALIQVLLLACASQSSDEQVSLFPSDPFAVTAILNYRRADNTNQQFKSTEYYSDTKGRGVIKSNQFQYHATRGQGENVLYSVYNDESGLISQENFWKATFNLSPYFERLLWLLKLEKSDYIIGLARLVLVVKANIQKLKPSKYSEAARSLEIKDENFAASLDVLYKPSRDGSVNPRDFPLTITCYDNNDKIVFKVDYSVWLYTDHSDSIQSEQDRNVVSKWIDMFTYPLGINLSKHMSGQRIYEIGIDNGHNKMSFRAKTYIMQYNGLGQLVNVDFEAGLVRVDTRDKFNDTVILVDLVNNKQHLVQKTLGYNYEQAEPECKLLEFPVADNALQAMFKLVLGTNKFSYMGRGKVRGGTVKIFEGSMESFPIWMDLWSPVSTEVNLANVKRGRSGMKNLKDLSITLYVHDDGVSSDNLIVTNIVLIEANAFIGKNIYTIFQAEIYNYVNDLTAPTDVGRVSNLFSLPECYSYQNSYADLLDVEILLESDGSIGSDVTLENPDDRDRVLIETFSKILHLPVESFLTMESKLNRHQSSNLLIDINFRLGLRVPEVRRIILLGKGWATGIGGKAWKAKTPAECLMNFDTYSEGRTRYFMFDATYDICRLDTNIKDKQEMVDGKVVAFHLAKDGYPEIFEVLRIQPTTADTARQTLNYLRSNKDDRMAITIQGQPAWTNFRISEVKFNLLNLSTANEYVYQGLKLNNHYFNGENTDQSSKDWISLEKCETICFEQFDCKTFSYCQSESDEPKCLISTMSLEPESGQPSIKDQLAKSGIIGKNRGAEMVLNLADGKLTLVRDRKCSIHRKRHHDMFIYSASSANFPEHRNVIRVKDIEDCASRCFHKSLEVIQKLQSLDKNITKFLSSSTPDTDIENTLAQVKSLQSNRIQLVSEFCDKFQYIDQTYSTSSTAVVDAYMRSIESDQSQGDGFCIIDPKFLKVDYSKTKSFGFAIFEVFNFDYRRLYIERRDIVMKTSLDIDQHEAYKKAAKGQRLTTQEIESISRSMINGQNFIYYDSYTNARLCARRCFQQTNPIFPACQSFDVYQISSVNDQCALSSATSTSRDVVNITTGEHQHETSVHYEPRFGLSKLDTFSNLEVLKESLWSKYFPRPPSHGWLIFFLIILGIATGLFAGIRIVGPIAYCFNLRGSEQYNSDLSSILVPEPIND